MRVNGTMIFARNELLALVYLIDKELQSGRFSREDESLLPVLRGRLMREVNNIDQEGNW